MAHLAHRTLCPESITVVELDPVVAEMARLHMGLSEIPSLDVRIADVHVALAELRDGPGFDLVIEDIFHCGLPARSDDSVGSFITALENVLSTEGTLVFDRWFRKRSGEEVDADQERLVRLLHQRFDVVIRRRIEQRFLNELIFAGARRNA
jgi:spermidine synthase